MNCELVVERIKILQIKHHETYTTFPHIRFHKASCNDDLVESLLLHTLLDT